MSPVGLAVQALPGTGIPGAAKLVGTPGLNKPSVAVPITGAASASKRKLYSVDQCRALAFLIHRIAVGRKSH